MRMTWFERTMAGIAILGIIALLGFAGLYAYNRVGIKTYTGKAAVTGCTYKKPWTQISMIGKTTMVIQHAEEWWVWLPIDNQQAALQVTENTCRSPVDTMYRVEYGYGRADGDLIIKGFAP